MVVLLILLIAPFPLEARRLFLTLLTVGWLLAGVGWSYRRFGWKAVAVIATTTLAASGIGVFAYWQDEPNRRVVAEIKKLHASYVGTTGKLLTGDVDYVFFDSSARDDDIGRFTELEGLDGLERLVLRGTRVSDATAKKLTRLTQLKDLYIEGSDLNDDTVDELFAKLPNCRIEVK